VAHALATAADARGRRNGGPVLIRGAADAVRIVGPAVPALRSWDSRPGRSADQGRWRRRESNPTGRTAIAETRPTRSPQPGVRSDDQSTAPAAPGRTEGAPGEGRRRPAGAGRVPAGRSADDRREDLEVDRLEGVIVGHLGRAGGQADDQVHLGPELDRVAGL